MLKKAGIVVAATTAALLSISPLAFAGGGDGGYPHGHDGGYHHTDDGHDHDGDHHDGGGDDHDGGGHDGGGDDGDGGSEGGHDGDDGDNPGDGGDNPGGNGGSNSVDHTSMGLVNVSGNNVNGTANGVCNNDVTGSGGVAAQKDVPIQAAALLGALAPSTGATANNTSVTQDSRDCSVGSTGAGHNAGGQGGGAGGAEGGSDGDGAGAGGGSNSIDHTSMGLVNVSDNNVNGTVNALCNNDVAAGGIAAAQKGVPVQAVGGALAPVTSNNALGTQDGRSCSVDETSAGDSAGN